VSNFTNLDKLILLLSCCSHDVDHPGNNNLFEVNSRSLLALTYNDKSVLENYHLFLFFNFLNNENMNIFIGFDHEQMKVIRKQFINNIIATDMANHKQDLNKLKDMIAPGKDFNPQKPETKDFISTQLIHFADISNGAKPFNIFNKWVDLLFKEFFTQGDKEKELGLPVSMLCDREKVAIPDTQVFFINVFAMDIAKTIEMIYPKVKIFVDALEVNKGIWEERKKSEYSIDEK
jgi:hypothetical protein